MAAVFHRRHDGEGLRGFSAFPFPFPFSEALLSSLCLERPSLASVGSAGRAAARGSARPASQLRSMGCSVQTARAIPTADYERLLCPPWCSTPSITRMPAPSKWVRRELEVQEETLKLIET